MSTNKDTDQPISTKKSAKPKYVTHDDLQAFEKAVEGAVNSALEEQFKNVEELVSSKINASNAEISKALMQHGEAINSIAAAIQGGQPQQSQQAPQSRTAKIEEITEIANRFLDNPIIKQKLGLEADPLTQEADALINANWTAAKREFIAQQKRQLKQAFKRSLVFPEEVEGMIETAGSKAVEHGI